MCVRGIRFVRRSAILPAEPSVLCLSNCGGKAVFCMTFRVNFMKTEISCF